MLFNSFIFIVFFCLVTVIYFSIPSRAQNSFLLVASCLFYIWGIPKYILVLASMIVLDFALGISIESARGNWRKIFLGLSLVSNIGILCLFKYWNFLSDILNALNANVGMFSFHWPSLSWALPIGLSFHTFQSMSYIIEVYKGNTRAERNPLVFALDIMFFPQLVAGPIERPNHFLPQLRRSHRFNPSEAALGLKLILRGFVKKMLVADNLAAYADPIFADVAHQTGGHLLLATYCFSFQIFCDFSGYVDIARGCAHILGFALSPNFESPYLAVSLKEFWHRWHISLSTWFRDYLYIPLGGSRRGQLRNCLNLVIVFLLSGLWHGGQATFLIWGCLHACGLITSLFFANALKRLGSPAMPTVLKWLLTFNFICLCWIPFRAVSLQDFQLILRQVLQTSWHVEAAPTLIFVLMLGTLAFEFLSRNRTAIAIFFNSPFWVRWLVYNAAVVSVFCFAQIESKQFIYFQF